MSQAPAFRYSHQWEPGDFVIWDNCGLRRRVAPMTKIQGAPCTAPLWLGSSVSSEVWTQSPYPVVIPESA